MAADGKPQNVLTDLDEDTLSAIRNLVSETEIAPAQKPVDVVASHHRETVRPAPSKSADSAFEEPRSPVRHIIADEPSIAPPKTRGVIGRKFDDGKVAIISRVQKAKASMLGYRPTPKHMIIAAGALLILFRPWLVAAVMLLNLILLVGIFLILGYDGFWKKMMVLGRWYASKRPSRSVELQRKLDNFAVRWDAILDRFPEGTVDALYMPDFSELEQAEARHDAVMARRLEALVDK